MGQGSWDDRDSYTNNNYTDGKRECNVWYSYVLTDRGLDGGTRYKELTKHPCQIDLKNCQAEETVQRYTDR